MFHTNTPECVFFLTAPTPTASSAQAATLWQIIYYFGENPQTVNPQFFTYFLSCFSPVHLADYTAQPLTACKQTRNGFALPKHGEVPKEKLGKRSKSLRMEIACIKNVAVSYAFPLCFFIVESCRERRERLRARSSALDSTFPLLFDIFFSIFMWFLVSSARLSSVCRYKFAFLLII